MENEKLICINHYKTYSYDNLINDSIDSKKLETGKCKLKTAMYNIYEINHEKLGTIEVMFHKSFFLVEGIFNIIYNTKTNTSIVVGIEKC